MAVEATVNIAHMIDLATVGSEVGKVDCNMLQAVLHIMAKQQGILDKSVKLRGDMGAYVSPPQELALSLSIQEVVLDSLGREKSLLPKLPKIGATRNTIFVVDRVTKEHSHTSSVKASSKSENVIHEMENQIKELQEAVFGQQRSEAAGGGGGTTAGRSVRIETTRRGGPQHIVGDVDDETVINRLYDCEVSINCIACLLQDFINLSPELRTSLQVAYGMDLKEFDITSAISLISKGGGGVAASRPQDTSGSGGHGGGAGGGGGPDEGHPRRPAGSISRARGESVRIEGISVGPKHVILVGEKITGPTVLERLFACELAINNLACLIQDMINLSPEVKEGLAFAYGLEGDLFDLSAALSFIRKGGGGVAMYTRTGSQQRHGGKYGTAGTGMYGAESGMVPTCEPGQTANCEDIIAIYEHLNRLQAMINELNSIKNVRCIPGVGELLDAMERLNRVEKKVEECCEDFSLENSKLLRYIDSVQEQITLIAKEIYQEGKPKFTKEYADILNGIPNLYAAFDAIKAQFQIVLDLVDTLEAERKEREENRLNMIEQIELLKILKADREDVSDALDEKANVEDLATKVTYEEFENACKDLQSKIDQAIEKLQFQESLWRQALDDIDDAFALKLDRVELDAVKTYFCKKMKELQDYITTLANVRRDVDTSGAKKVLRDISCLTCDADVVMRDQARGLPQFDSLPSHKSKSPSICFGLEHLRWKKKHPNNILKQPNPKDWDMDEESKKPKTRAKSDISHSACYRYCGGLHTVTTPNQRLLREGHFLKQFGPQSYPLPSEMGAGDDGKLYKFSAEVRRGKKQQKPMKAVPPETTSRYLPPPVKPIPVIKECRCLEGDESS